MTANTGFSIHYFYNVCFCISLLYLQHYLCVVYRNVFIKLICYFSHFIFIIIFRFELPQERQSDKYIKTSVVWHFKSGHIKVLQCKNPTTKSDSKENERQNIQKDIL